MIDTTLYYSERLNQIPSSFIREILKVAEGKNMISFAGGLPNPEFFPVKEIAEACEKVLSREGRSLLQYSVTEGFLPLRQFIAERHQQITGTSVTAEQVIILNGAQQGIDLSGKIFVNSSDTVLLEDPSYLGAIQSYSAYSTKFKTIEMDENGISLDRLKRGLTCSPKLFYAIPSYQNPTGISYSEERRIAVADILYGSGTLLIEDNPYGEIYFGEKNLSPLSSYAPLKSVQLGSFSKIVSPGLRLGWAIAEKEIINRFAVCKQSSDLHSNNFSQRVLFQYLMDNNLDDHLRRIRKFYKRQRDLMIEKISKYLPPEVKFTIPGGGMFLWLKLPSSIYAEEVLKETMKEKVIFVPGNCFNIPGNENPNTIRLNYSNPCEIEMDAGMKALGRVICEMLSI